MRGKWRAQRADRGAHAARGFVGGAAAGLTTSGFRLKMFQCRTRLCGWCSTLKDSARRPIITVSMPHAALWVVQQFIMMIKLIGSVFQCRTRLCGWCNVEDCGIKFANLCFNAARGFVGGATVETC